MSHDIRTIVQPNIASRQLDFLIDTVDVRDEDIIADKLRLTQVLLNILSNGIKFNKIGGIIGIRGNLCLPDMEATSSLFVIPESRELGSVWQLPRTLWI